MKKKLMFLMFTLALTLVVNQAAFAACPANSCTNCTVSNQIPDLVPLTEKLNLSDRQVQQLKEINLNTYQTTKALKIKLMDAKFELKQLAIEGKDKTAINAKTREINDLKAQLKKAYQEKRQKVKSMLTVEQQSKLNETKGFGGHCGRDMLGSH
ncbi:MAG: Spy/CpxP family protein refolding chaperone [Syntrophomonas sp.]